MGGVVPFLCRLFKVKMIGMGYNYFMMNGTIKFGFIGIDASCLKNKIIQLLMALSKFVESWEEYSEDG